MEGALGVAVVVVIIVVISVVLSLSGRRALSESWAATIERVEEFERLDPQGRRTDMVQVNWVRVHYRRDDGVTGQFENSMAAFLAGGMGSVEVGDRLVKEAGQAPKLVKT
ncbi:MAG: hypothetical protein HY815_03605 [Candidatus Riflebacteria bacterium]|nr:hypothetical protein [Candidatus Riflebacteria bacterium]